MSDSPKGTPPTSQFLVELFCGGGFSASVGKMPAAVTQAHIYAVILSGPIGW